MKYLLVGLACAVCGWLPAPAGAAVQVADLAVTHAYLRAGAVYDTAMNAGLGASAAAIEARASGIGEECPSAFLYAPRDRAFRELGEETDLDASRTTKTRGYRLAHDAKEIRIPSGTNKNIPSSAMKLNRTPGNPQKRFVLRSWGTKPWLAGGCSAGGSAKYYAEHRR